MLSPLSAGEAFTEAVAADVDVFLRQVRAVRTGADDAVHQLRVTTRRLRSLLRSGRRLARKHPARRLRAELRWLAMLLGDARDAEVRAERLSGLARLDGGTVSGALAAQQRARYATAYAGIVAALDSDRYRQLTTELARWRERPPLRKHAAAPAAVVYSGILRHELHRLRALAAHTSTADVAGLHEVRKAAKRLRYSAEAARRADVANAAELAGQAKTLQSVLGEHRDAVETAQLIGSAAAVAETRTTAYRKLLAAEHGAAAAALRRYPAAAAFAG